MIGTLTSFCGYSWNMFLSMSQMLHVSVTPMQTAGSAAPGPGASVTPFVCT